MTAYHRFLNHDEMPRLDDGYLLRGDMPYIWDIVRPENLEHLIQNRNSYLFRRYINVPEMAKEIAKAVRDDLKKDLEMPYYGDLGALILPQIQEALEKK